MKPIHSALQVEESPEKVIKQSQSVWYVYMVACADGSLYTGITTDLKRRIDQHNGRSGGAKYTRSRQPVTLVHYEEYASRSEAGKREFFLKKLTLQKKQRLIRSSTIPLTT